METERYELTTGGYWTQEYEADASSLQEALQIAGETWEEGKRTQTVQVWNGQTLLVTFQPVCSEESCNGDDDDE